MSESFAVKRTAKVAEIDDDGEIDLATAKSKHLAIEKEKASMARQCPYLDTIDRNVLDFGNVGNPSINRASTINMSDAFRF